MANISNRDRINKALELLAEGLADPVDEVMTKLFGRPDWDQALAQRDGSGRSVSKDDPSVQLRMITENRRAFSDVLSHAQQAYAGELREVRNLFAHNYPFDSDDTMRALDTVDRLLQAVNAPDSAADVRKLRQELQRQVYEDAARHKSAKALRLSSSTGLQPWRQVVHPHEDVAKGDFTASEFAADLHQVATGAAQQAEYADPVEFFRRTYLTEGLTDLLTQALRRLGGDANASPVVNLQTNFGGGKTHSLLALYHLFGGTRAADFPQELQDLIAKSGAEAPPKVRRVVIVGNRLRAGAPSAKPDGTLVHTIWGELAWQLGGRAAYDLVAADDQAGTSPGDALRTLIARHAPALILVDEWVAYARDLVGKDDLAAGTFDTQFTFAQTLTESVPSVPGAMLVVSIPASDTADGRGDDIEIGGRHGQEALKRLQNVIRRVADQWRPSTRDESFEIVRRRLFQAPDADALAQIAVTAKAFTALYRRESKAFPSEASADMSYERRIRDCYPLHPELLDRLYEDWSTLERFQRTRGVLRLVSSVVHTLWRSKDESPLILPGNVPLDAERVNADLTQYLEDKWRPIIDSDIDSDNATAARIDAARSVLGARHVTRRLARTIFMGAAPRAKSERKGLDRRYLWLGTAMPSDVTGNFDTALDAMEQQSTYFYVEQGSYWFDTRPSVTRTATDYAERLREEPEAVWEELVRRLRRQADARDVFDRVHVAPESSGDVPDLDPVRLVIAHPRHTRAKSDGPDSESHVWARQMVESKGVAQRVHRNQLVLLLADRGAMERLAASTRSFLGWRQVRENAEQLNLTPQQLRQAKDSEARYDRSVSEQLEAAYQWSMFPSQPDAKREFLLDVVKVIESWKSMAPRVADRLRRDGLLVSELAAPVLGLELHSHLSSLFHGRHISVGEVWAYFTRYPYLPRLTGREVLDAAVAASLMSVMVDRERFALAGGYDADKRRYVGLTAAGVTDSAAALGPFQVTDSTLLVDWDVAVAQAERERVVPLPTPPVDDPPPAPQPGPGPDPKPGPRPDPAPRRRTRYFGHVELDPTRYGASFSNISKEVLERLQGQGAKLRVTIEIEARLPSGFDEAAQRTISENSQTLRFDAFGFETD